MPIQVSRRQLAGGLLSALLLTTLPVMQYAQSKPKAKSPTKSVPKSVPKVTITQMPTASPSEQLAEKNIAGTVTNAPKDSKIIIYALGDNYDKWYIQPFETSSTTTHSDGKWNSQTHGGYEFVIYLAKSSYKPEANPATLPKVGGDILAMARAKPKR